MYQKYPRLEGGVHWHYILGKEIKEMLSFKALIQKVNKYRVI